jgi:hypothetical protein
MAKSKNVSKKTGTSPGVVGIAWYSPSQWKRLREVAADPEELEQTHREWMESCKRTMAELANRGLNLVKVPVDVSELQKWCQRKNLIVDGRARAQYVLEWVQRNHAARIAISEE